MRTTFSGATVRLYHLDSGADGGAVNTLFYGSLTQAMEMAASQPEDLQDGLFIATDNDVVSYLDLLGG